VLPENPTRAALAISEANPTPTNAYSSKPRGIKGGEALRIYLGSARVQE
jgi:hypothetical protein